MKPRIIALAAAGLLLPLTPQAQPLVNLGLVGVGHLSGDSFDQLGTNVDTLGGVFSGMWLVPGSISKVGNTFYGTIIGLPDRGFGDGLRDYHPRIEQLRFSLTPHYGTGPAPQNQISITNTGTLLLSQNGNLFTGALPDDTNEMNFPKSLATGVGGGKWSLDPEGIVVVPDGSFYVSDEYGPFVYHFGINGQLADVLVPPAAYIPRRGPVYPRVIDYNVTINPTNESGRYNNRGLEGLTLTPDGKKLVTVIQSPLAQDGENRNPSRNARILIYDIDPASPTVRQAVAEYVV
jgi:hypothetical protein